MKQAINNTHNELINNGWMCVNSHNNKYIYQKSKPYDEFIIDNSFPGEISITVPIPFRDSAMYYKNTFRDENINNISDYIKIHLFNYNNMQ